MMKLHVYMYGMAIVNMAFLWMRVLRCDYRGVNYIRKQDKIGRAPAVHQLFLETQGAPRGV